MQEARWLFFDLGNTLISEEAATVCRIQRLVNALARHGRRYSIDEVRSAFEEASAKFAPRPVISVIEKLVDDPACRRAVAVEAPYPKELEAPYEGAEEVLRTLATRAERVDPSRRGNVGGGPLADEYPVQPAVP